MSYNDKLWERTIPFVDKDGDTIDASEIGGFMTQDQKDFIADKHRDLRVNNEIELTRDLEVMLNEIVLEHFGDGMDDVYTDHEEAMDDILDIVNKNASSDEDGEIVKRGIIPADIVFANTMPVPNMRVIRKNTIVDLNSGKHDGVNVYTILMYDDIISKLDDISDHEEVDVVIGFIRRDLFVNGERRDSCGYPIITNVNTDTPSLRVDRFHCLLPQQGIDIYSQMPEDKKQDIISNIVEVYVEMSTILAHYYAIQQLLLNPLVKKYSTTTRVVDQFKKGGGKNGKKKPVKYIKRIKLDTDDVTNLIYKKDENGERVRKTLIWYVCGHWVNRKGTRFFRHGYWKGPLRDSNPELFVDGVRQREIV